MRSYIESVAREAKSVGFVYSPRWDAPGEGLSGYTFGSPGCVNRCRSRKRRWSRPSETIMSDDGSDKGLHIDSDWKEEAAREKERLSQQVRSRDLTGPGEQGRQRVAKQVGPIVEPREGFFDVAEELRLVYHPTIVVSRGEGDNNGRGALGSRSKWNRRIACRRSR